MNYRIESESAHRIRIRLFTRTLTGEQADILRYAFSNAPGVTRVTVYRATACCALEYRCAREQVISRLDAFRFENVRMMAEKEEQQREKISASEMKDRKLEPALKRKLRMRILGETIADAVLPLPVQLAYHAWQMITLKEL